MNKRLHVLGLPWTETTDRYLHCAYTAKVKKFCSMMTDGGYEVFLYAGEENEARCVEHVALVSAEERIGWFGEWDTNNLFSGIDWDPRSAWWQLFNARAIEEIQIRAEQGDIVCLVTRTQDGVAEALPDLMPVEFAVGYEGIRNWSYPNGAPASRVFESYAWMHHVYGKYNINDGAAFDAVIPNFFDDGDFYLGDGGGGYAVFLGRIVQRKGPHVAAAITERLGMRLKVAGPGAVEVATGRISAPEISIVGDKVEYAGPVGITERAELLANAAVAIVPTLYIEPFGGVAVEAMLAGTPVVASDWGAFSETVDSGVTGYRFRTLRGGAQAVQNALLLDRAKVRERAVERFSLPAVFPQFDTHFRSLDTLWADGWYAD